MKNIKKIIIFIISLSLFCVFFSSCSYVKQENSTTNTTAKKKETATIKLLIKDENKKAEFENLLKIYEEETGTKVIIENSQKDILPSDLKQNNAPTIIEIDNKEEFENLKNDLIPLNSTTIYEKIIDKNFVLKDEENVLALPFNTECFGIIYNEKIMDKYFSLENRKTKYNSFNEIRSFKALKDTINDLEKFKKELNIDNVFSFDKNDKETANCLLSVLNYYKNNKNSENSNLNFSKNLEDFNSFFENENTNKDFIDEFKNDKTALIVANEKNFKEILKMNLKNNDAQYKILPLYMGIPNEEKQGIGVNTKSFLALNKNLSEKEISFAKNFLEFLYSSKNGVDFYINSLNYFPLTNSLENENKSILKSSIDFIKKEGINTIFCPFDINKNQ